MHELAHITGPDDGLRELALFAGAGGGILGGMLLGWRTVCAVEIEPYPASVLIQRQNDGILPPFPIWDDVCTFDGKPWRGRVDVVSGGFPCQPFSHEGRRDWETSDKNMWPETKRIISEVRAQFVLLENVPGVRQYLPVVVRDLRRMGYTVKKPIIASSGSAGAIHIRERVWVLAYDDSQRRERQRDGVCKETRTRFQTWAEFEGLVSDVLRSCVPSRSGNGVHDAVAGRLDRLAAIGNGQDPAVVRLAWDILSEGLI